MRVKGNKSGSTFYDKSCYAVLSATPNLWDNIQIVRTYILKHNVSNLVNLVIRNLDFETLHCCFRHASDEVMNHVFNNVEDMKKIYFPIQKYVYYSCTLRKMYQWSFPENPTCSSKPLGLIHSDLLELLTLSYSKYKWVISFLDDHFFFYNITFLCKKSETVDTIKSIFQI